MLADVALTSSAVRSGTARLPTRVVYALRMPSKGGCSAAGPGPDTRAPRRSFCPCDAVSHVTNGRCHGRYRARLALRRLRTGCWRRPCSRCQAIATSASIGLSVSVRDVKIAIEDRLELELRRWQESGEIASFAFQHSAHFWRALRVLQFLHASTASHDGPDPCLRTRPECLYRSFADLAAPASFRGSGFFSRGLVDLDMKTQDPRARFADEQRVRPSSADLLEPFDPAEQMVGSRPLRCRW